MRNILLSGLLFLLYGCDGRQLSDGDFKRVGTVEGCTVYHHYHSYGGSTFAVCHK